MKDRVIWLARYEGFFRHICRGIREGDGPCIRQAAHFYAAMLPEKAMVIPMPGHDGVARQMLAVAIEIAKLRKDIIVADIMASNKHASHYDVKKDGCVPLPVKMSTTKFIIGESDRPRVIIDNVVVTGVTAQAALEALPSAMVFCLCKDMWR